MNKKMLALVLVSSAPSVFADVSKAAPLKTDLNIGYVDSFEAMRMCAAGQEASKEIEKQRTQLAADIQKAEQELTQVANEFKSKAATLSDAARKKEENRIIKMRTDFESKVKESEEELQMSMQEKTSVLAKDIEEGIVAVAKAKNLDAVVDKMTGRAVYVKSDVDFTKDAITEVDKQRSQKLAQNKSQKASAAA